MGYAAGALSFPGSRGPVGVCPVFCVRSGLPTRPGAGRKGPLMSTQTKETSADTPVVAEEPKEVAERLAGLLPAEEHS